MVIILDDPWGTFPRATHNSLFDMIKDAKFLKDYTWFSNDSPGSKLVGYFGQYKTTPLKYKSFYIGLRSLRSDSIKYPGLMLVMGSIIGRLNLAKRISENTETYDELIESLKKGII